MQVVSHVRDVSVMMPASFFWGGGVGGMGWGVVVGGGLGAENQLPLFP